MLPFQEKPPQTDIQQYQNALKYIVAGILLLSK